LTGGSTFARRYQIIEDLGKGGMGRVYKVFDTEVREKMALKLLHPDIAGPAAHLARWQQHQGGGKRSGVDTHSPGL
jgi:serine/threonine protein kinase